MKFIRAVMLALVLLLLPIRVQAQEKNEEYWDGVAEMMICVEAEAGNQDEHGKRLVAAVILNRVDSQKYPNTIIEVIEQKNQFSSFSNGAMDRVGEVPESTRKAVLAELESRTDSTILFFTAGHYGKYGTPAYKYGGHYFSK